MKFYFIISILLVPFLSISQEAWINQPRSQWPQIALTNNIVYKNGDQWLPVKNTKSYDVLKDQYSEISFEAVTTKALRLEVTLPKEHSSGILEWSVK